MEKLFLLFSSGLLIFTSCRKDDDNPNSEIVGKWNFTKYIVYSGKDNSILFSDDLSECDKKDGFNFKPNGTVSATDFNEDIDGNCVGGEVGTGNYTFDKNALKLTMSVDGNEEITFLRSFTKNEMQLIIDDSVDSDLDGTEDIEIIVLNK
jgi:hypothetical protein